MSKNFYITLFLAISIITSCSKNVSDTDNNNTGNPVNQNQDSTKSLFVVTAADSTTTIKSYNSSFNPLWSKQLQGSYLGYNYSDGSFYVTTERFDYVTYKGTYFFYCLNATNGSVKWSVNGTDKMYTPVFIGTKIYCNGYTSNGGSNIITFNANNGTVISKYFLGTQYGTAFMQSDSSSLYFLYVTQNTDYKVASYSTITNNITWSQSIGIRFDNSIPRPVLFKDKVAIQTNAGTLECYDKKTGSVSWTVNGSNFNQAMAGQDNVCSMSQSNGYYGYDNQTGQQKWFNAITKNLHIPSLPFLPGENIFFAGKDATNWALYSISAGTGTLNYKKDIRDELKKITAVGSDLYGVYDDNTATNLGYILMLLSSDKGIAKDSIKVACERLTFGIVTSADKFVTYQ